MGPFAPAAYFSGLDANSQERSVDLGPCPHHTWVLLAVGPVAPGPLPARAPYPALDVPVLALQRRRPSRHAQLCGRGAMDGHVAGRCCGHRGGERS